MRCLIPFRLPADYRIAYYPDWIDWTDYRYHRWRGIEYLDLSPQPMTKRARTPSNK